MTESGPNGRGRTALADRVRATTLGGVCRRLTLISFAALCVAVAVVGGVAVVAESISTWTWYFRMEQTVALATPVVGGLLVISLGGAMASVMFTRDWG